MKLYWSSRSPFVRKVMIAAHEVGLADRIACERTVVSHLVPNEALVADNPLIQLPTLVLDDGTAIYDSPVICEYFDTLHDGPKLFPAAFPERLVALRHEALGDGTMDLLLKWLIERLRPPASQSSEFIKANAFKFKNIVQAMNDNVESLVATPFGIGHIAIGCALSYADFRFRAIDWRKGHSGLAAWHAGFEERPSVRANPAVDDSEFGDSLSPPIG